MFPKFSAEGGDKSSVLQDSALIPKAGWSQGFFNTAQKIKIDKVSIVTVDLKLMGEKLFV